MSIYLNEDLYLFYLFLLAIILSAIILGASYVLSIQNESTSKLSSYECGFDPFEDARNIFDVHFYLVAILFLVLDLEVMFLFPWAVSLNSICLKGFIGMVIFLVILIRLIRFCVTLNDICIVILTRSSICTGFLR